MHRFIWIIVVFASILAISACGTGNESNSTNDGNVAKLRFTGIPDSDKDQLTKKYDVVKAYLAKETGMEVEYVHVPNYKAAVDALAANKVDIVWLGGVTSVEAENVTNGEARLLTCRESDLKFKSYVIVHKDSFKGKVKTLDEMKDKYDLSSMKLTFGSELSTSGHIMPRHYLTDGGLKPEDTFADVAWQGADSHAGTLREVNNGNFHIGALNYKQVDVKAKPDQKANIEIIWETPPYVDYCMVGHSRVGDDVLNKITEAFTKLDASNEEHKGVLEAFSAGKFLKAKPSDWDGIRTVLKQVRAEGIIQ